MGCFSESDSFRSEEEPSEAKAQSGWSNIALNGESRTVRFLTPGLALDLGGIGMGWALNRTAHRRRELEVGSVLVGLGRSNYVAIGASPKVDGWRITIPESEGPGESLSDRWLRNIALSTFGNSRSTLSSMDWVFPRKRGPLDQRTTAGFRSWPKVLEEATVEATPDPRQETPEARPGSGPSEELGLRWKRPWWNAGSGHMNQPVANNTLHQTGFVPLLQRYRGFACTS